MKPQIREADSRAAAPTTIGVLVSIVDPYQPFWVGAVNAARDRDVHAVCFAGGVLPPDDSPIRSASLAELPAAAFYDIIDVNDLDGIVTWAGGGAGLGEHLSEQEMAQFIKRYRAVPLVNYEGIIDGIPNVATDTYPGMCDLLTHLIEVHGRRRIALIRGPFGHRESEERTRAYMDTLARHDIPFDPTLICPPGGWGLGYGRPAVTHLIDTCGLRPGHDFNAIAATEIGYALGCVPALQERGIIVPDEVAVVGFNDHPSALEMDPPITTMQKPFYTSGYRAMEAVLELTQGRPVPPRIDVPVQAKWRASCGCDSGDAAAAPDQEIGGPPVHQRTVDYASMLFSISDDLMQTRSTAGLAAVLAQRLPEVGIQGCYIALYEGSEPFGMRKTAPPWSSIVLSFQHGKLVEPTSAPRRIRTRALVREILAQEEEASAWMATPLHFSHQQFGFVVFQVGLRVGLFYHRLAHEISDALHAILVLPDYERTHRSLRESEARMHTLIEHLPVAFWAKDTDGVYFMQNSVMREMIGDNQGLTLEEIAVDEALRAEWLEQDAQVMKGETVFSEHTLRRDDEPRVYQQIVSPVIVDGDVIAIQGLMLDVSEQKQLEATLRQAKEEAEAANQVKSRFLATMSHELRTPLNAILGYSELLTRDPQLTPDQREHLGIIERSGSHLLGLINDVLDLARIEAGKAELRETGFDLHEALLGLREMFSLRAEEKGLSLVFDLGPDVPRTIYADEGKLRQVLINLLSNAIKFTEVGGIRVTVATQPPEDLSAPAAHPTDAAAEDAPISWLQFTVKDTGIGITADEMDLVFEAFDQTESGRRAGQGTGLGLPLSREYVRLMGGELTLTSEVGNGTCFRFALPVRVLRTDGPPPAETRPEIVASASRPERPDVDPAWVRDLRRAAMEGDIQWIARLIDQIQPSHRGLADELGALAERYAHEAILDILSEISDEA
jgi:PAS domain S-box-containing protein